VRAAVCWAILLLVVLLAAGHILYGYLPRERAGSPAPGGLPARMLASSSDEACFWVPYPHQNLAALARALGNWEEYVAAASRLAGLPPPQLPGFGPFAVPPASEVAACSDSSGRRVLVGAEIYPAIALVAKAAGRLAGNPWLAGGEVPGREPPTRVAWRGNEWTVSLGGAEPPPASPAPQAPPGDALALLRLARPVAGSLVDLPAGTYRLGRDAAGDLELALAGSVAPPTVLDLAGLPQLPPDSRPALLAVAGATEKGPAAALALFPSSSRSDLGLPGAAAFQPAGVPGRGRWSLPGGGIAGLLARALPRGNAAGWSIVAIDAASLAKAETLAPILARAASPAAGPRLRLGLRVEPAAALELVAAIRKLLERVPLASPREVERWRDGETLLAPLARCREISAVSTGPPDAFALRLAGCRG
jgi:hypothetical protein